MGILDFLLWGAWLGIALCVLGIAAIAIVEWGGGR